MKNSQNSDIIKIMKGEIPMKSIERITQISEEIWHDMCGEESTYEIEQETVLHGSQELSDDAGGGESDL